MSRRILPPIIAATEIFFQPAVQRDKKVPAAHFPDLELGSSGTPVTPCDRHGRPGVAANDDLERKLDSKVEMRREERATTVQRALAISLESVSEIVQWYMKQESQKRVGEAIDQQFVRGVVDDAAPADETRAESRVPPLVEQFPIADHITAIIGFVGHHDDYGVAGAVVDSEDHGTPKTVRPLVPNGM